MKSVTLGGYVLAEILVALMLGLIALTSLTGIVIAALRWNRALTSRVEGLEVARTVWLVLEEELRGARIVRDWTLDSDEVLSLRAFRGLGRICGESDGSWVVAYRGRREPDPARDSLLVLGSDARWHVRDLESVASPASSGSCSEDAADTVLGLTWSGDRVPAAILLRVFERGSYHLADGAFRYRRGSAGRQPLTVERVADSSRFDIVNGSLQITLELTRTVELPGPASLVWRLSEAGPAP